ncbi:MAG: two-component system sensor histidine kinase NtrB [Pseudomonadota bacterium]
MAGQEGPIDRRAYRDSLTEAIIDSAIDGIITIDARGIIHSFNFAAERMFGYGREEAIGRNVSFLMPSPDRERHDGYISRYQKSGYPRIIGTGRNVIGLRKDGEVVHIHLAVAEYKIHGQAMFVGFTHDRTELNRAQIEAQDYMEKLVYLNRVNALGELASGLAHEIRQPLMAIQAYATAARKSIEVGDSPYAGLHETLDEITRQSIRANDIIREAWAFLKHGEHTKKETIDLVSMSRKALSLLSHEVRASYIRFEFDTAQPSCFCHVSRIQIEQVLYNLISNAIDSLRESDGEKVLRLHCERQDATHQCVVTVEDNGAGIPEEYMGRLWDPFFTTKEKGMGQGLAICRSILQRHGGEISAENADGGGAIFRFTLPSAEQV